MATRPAIDLSEFESEDNFAASAKGILRKPENAHINEDACNQLISELSADQLAAATTSALHTLLIAPAGTGKTKTLTSRVAHLLSQGAKPEEILICTYTNAAAKELIERVTPILKISPKDMWIGTLHAIGLRILRAQGHKEGRPNNQTIIDEVQQNQLILQMMMETHHPSFASPEEGMIAGRIRAFIQEAKNRMMSPEDVLVALRSHSLGWAHGVGREEVEVYAAYQRHTNMYNMLDYSDMLYLPTKLIEEEGSEKVRALWQNKFKHVLVDEYQDVAASQVRFLRNLIGSKASFFVAADDDQCIYSWRGSELKHVTEFLKYWPNATIKKLEHNFRTPRAIFRAAGSLIINNTNRYDKNIKTRDDGKAFVRVVECADPQDEKQRILNAIIDAHQNMDVDLTKMAVLCRVNRMCGEIAAFLEASKIPVNLHEPLPLHAPTVSGLLSWIQAAEGHDNPHIFEKIATIPDAVLDDGKIREIIQRVTAANERNPDKRQGPIAYLRDLRERGKVPQGSNVDQLLDQIEKVRQLINEKPFTPFAEVGQFLGISHIASLSERPDDRNYMKLVQMLDAMMSQNMTVADILASVTQLDINENKPGIHIMTIHGAKGLEFDVVFAPGWEEGEFPGRSRHDEDIVEEERRLAYVAITRARKMFMATWAAYRRGTSKPSRFIDEMGINK